MCVWRVTIWFEMLVKLASAFLTDIRKRKNKKLTIWFVFNQGILWSSKSLNIVDMMTLTRFALFTDELNLSNLIDLILIICRTLNRFVFAAYETHGVVSFPCILLYVLHLNSRVRAFLLFLRFIQKSVIKEVLLKFTRT
jgi:hypothetical protein